MRSFSIIIAMIIIAIACPLLAEGAAELGFSSGEISGPVEIKADRVEHDHGKNTYTAKGKVEVKDATRTLFADYVFLDDNTHDVTAIGNVVFEDVGDRVECDRMDLNLVTRKGTLERARIFIKQGNIYISGQDVKKTGDSQYKIKKGKFTTCGWDKPEWVFTSEDVDVTMEGYAKTKSTTFYILGVPVFYIPRGVFPVKSERQSGFLMPEFTLSSSDGMKFKQSYFWAISKDKDATMFAEYIENRGINVGGQFRYALKEDLRGEWESAIIDDRDYGHTRYNIKGKHEQVFFKDLQFKANIWHVSDMDYLKDFGKDVQERSENQLKSTVFVEKPLYKSFLTAEMAAFRNLMTKDNDTTFNYFPKISYFTEYIPVFGGKMYFDLNSNLTNFYREKGDTFTRFGVDPSLRLPYSFKGINTLLSATLYETAYLVNRSDTISKGTKQRQVFRFEGDVNTQFMRSFNPQLSWLESVQSIIKPSIKYNFIPGTSFKDLPQIDDRDKMDDVNTITYSIYHYLYDTSGDSGGSREVSYLEVSQTYGISGDLEESFIYKGSGSRFSDIDVRFTLNPTSNFSFAHESVFSVSGEGAKTLRNGFTYKVPNKYYFVVAHNYNKDVNNDIYLDLGGAYKVFEGSYQIRYSFMEKEWIDSMYLLRYRPGCWSTTLMLTQTKRPKDTSFKISFDLTGITSK